MPSGLPAGRKRRIDIQSANGIVEAEETNFFQIEPLKENVECYAMEDAPDVLCLGKRCQKYGYVFYWDPYSSTPYTTHPDGHIIPLTSVDYVPYLADFWNTENAPVMSYLPDSPMSASGKRGASDDTLVHDRTKAT